MQAEDRSSLIKRWEPVLNEGSLPPIKDNYRRGCVAQLLENQRNNPSTESHLAGMGQGMLTETTPAANSEFSTVAGNIGGFASGGGSATGGVAGYDPILISLVRRSMPQLIAYDICGVQPMNAPTGLIFAWKARYNGQSGDEALFDEADTGFSGNGGSQSAIGAVNAATSAYGSDWTSGVTNGGPMSTDEAERLGGPNSDDNPWDEMAFTIEKTGVFAETRGLKAEYTQEIAQDLKAVHGLSAEAELSNMLTTQIMSSMNRQIVRTIYRCAKRGSQVNVTTPGTFDLDTDSSGRWSVEKFKGLYFQIEREANRIAQETRLGRGNILICSSDVASALEMTGKLDYAPALEQNLNVDDAGTTFAGILSGKYKVFIDPYAANQSTSQFFCMGFKSNATAYGAGLFYCPYVPLQMVRATDPETFQPKIGFKTRYGLVANPFVELDDGSPGSTRLEANKNYFYRFTRVINLL